MRFAIGSFFDFIRQYFRSWALSLSEIFKVIKRFFHCICFYLYWSFMLAIFMLLLNHDLNKFPLKCYIFNFIWIFKVLHKKTVKPNPQKTFLWKRSIFLWWAVRQLHDRFRGHLHRELKSHCRHPTCFSQRMTLPRRVLLGWEKQKILFWLLMQIWIMNFLMQVWIVLPKNIFCFSCGYSGQL